MPDSIDQIIRKSQTLLLQNRDSGDISSITFIIFFLVFLVLFVLSAVIIKYGFEPRYMMFLALLILLLIIYRIRMSAAKAANVIDAKYKNIDPNNKLDYASGLVDYMDSGFDMKLTRVKLVRQFYILIFPIFLICTKEFFHGMMSAKALIWSIIVLYPISWLVWNIYFKDDLFKVGLLLHDVKSMRDRLEPITKNLLQQ